MIIQPINYVIAAWLLTSLDSTFTSGHFATGPHSRWRSLNRPPSAAPLTPSHGLKSAHGRGGSQTMNIKGVTAYSR